VVTLPVRSVPSAVVSLVGGELAVTVRLVVELPVLVNVSSVTATLLWVMNLVCSAVRPLLAVWTLVQWLGYCARSPSDSEKDASDTLIVYMFSLEPVGRSR
jgi:hypothetical protein